MKCNRRRFLWNAWYLWKDSRLPFSFAIHSIFLNNIHLWRKKEGYIVSLLYFKIGDMRVLVS